MNTNFVFTSESFTPGHPDKLCDMVSDAIVGRLLQRDPLSSVIAECAIATGIVFVAARIASDAGIDIPNTARDVIRHAGYDRNGFNVSDCTVMTSIAQLPLSERPRGDERELNEDEIDNIRAGDHATVFGYACDHTPAMLPLPIYLAHKLARRLFDAREALPYLACDGKTQVGIEFRKRQPHRIYSISLVASQKERDQPELDRLRADLLSEVVRPVLAEEEIHSDDETLFFINPAGPVIGGGPALHSGMTGRKTASDTYGEYSRCSSSALSGKDPLRIDRVGSYAARYAAKNVVAARLARECEVQLSYCIGLAAPVSVQVQTFGSGRLPDAEIAARLRRVFDFRLGAIVRQLHLRSLAQRDEDGFYQHLAVYGHVGRTDLTLPWDLPDRAEALQE